MPAVKVDIVARTPNNSRARKPGKQAYVKKPEPLGVGGTIGMTLSLVIPAGLLIWLVVTVISVTMPDLDLALGRSGTPGTATVLSCERVGKGRYDCDARFVFDDRSREPIVIDTVPDAEPGEVFPAALTPEGDRVLPTGARGVWNAVALLVALPFGLALIAFLTALFTRSRKAIIWTGAIGAPFLVLLVLGFAIGT
ncbi:hypothetical protein HII36_06580 [Nonomuraea sp. NN258]|uniref:hypothetical protein n=1 Tax=Nonomuraea antri TaxID=2730852 RepID=UPI001569FA4E|nr:hypothetical protein [Nonomuraea antri]NRQ31507.1 hypothetical protein [Nonomuraea antri]